MQGHGITHQRLLEGEQLVAQQVDLLRRLLVLLGGQLQPLQQLLISYAQLPHLLRQGCGLLLPAGAHAPRCLPVGQASVHMRARQMTPCPARESIQFWEKVGENMPPPPDTQRHYLKHVVGMWGIGKSSNVKAVTVSAQGG